MSSSVALPAYATRRCSRPCCKQREVDHVGPAAEQVVVTGSRADGIGCGEHPNLHSVVDGRIGFVSLASESDRPLNAYF